MYTLLQEIKNRGLNTPTTVQLFLDTMGRISA
jgi:hypothetical protein